ncbi:MAG TPA: TetR/AcrR family transcriptional regulator [Acidimicrobiales bacterium]|nr:TetR/AcrR family transcriptional regulator [Acidimicrobiales bacterium]
MSGREAGATATLLEAPSQLGRPRDPRVDELVLEATRLLLVKVGYRRLAIDAVARQAGVSRTTVRLRWKSKAELVFDAVAPDPRILEVPDTGSLEGDIRGCVENTVTLFKPAPMRAAFQGLLDDVRNHPDVRLALWARIYRPSIDGFTALVERATARGEVTQHIDPDVLFDLIAGSALYRLTVSGADPKAMTDQLVAVLTAGLGAKAPGPASASPTASPSPSISTKEQ